MSDRLYAHVGEVIADLGLTLPVGDETLLNRVRAASDWIDSQLGRFIPVTETRRFDGPANRKTLFVDPLLAVTSIIDDTTTLVSSDYLLYPRARHWENGPYTRIEIDPDAANLTAWTNERDIIAIVGRWGKYEQSAAIGATVANATQISASGTSLIVSDGSQVFPGMVLLIESEQLLVTAATDLAAATFTVKRGVNGTTGAAHLIGVAISRYFPPWDVNWLCRQIAGLMHKKAQSGFAGKVGSAELGEVFYMNEFPKDVVEQVRRNYRITSI